MQLFGQKAGLPCGSIVPLWILYHSRTRREVKIP